MDTTINIELSGSYTATHPATGLSVDTSKGRGKFKDPVGPLCRLLREHGHDEARAVRVTRGGTPVFKRDRTLADWAAHDVRDTQKGLETSKYRPFPLRSEPVKASDASDDGMPVERREAA